MVDTAASYHCMQFQGKLTKHEKIAKNLVLGAILGHLPQIRLPNFFNKNLASPVTRYHGQLGSFTISRKTNDPILRKLSDGQMDRVTEGQMDESDSIGRCPTKVKRPK